MSRVVKVVVSSLSFGNTRVAFELESSRCLDVLGPRDLVPSANEEGLVTEALLSTNAYEQLEQICGKNSRICIIVPDKTRNCGALTLLPILIKRLGELGLREEDLTIVVALGSHGKHKPDEIRKLFGSEILARVRILEHDCHSQSLVRLGETKFGTPIDINEELLNADRIIAVATAVHHYFAGFGGGPKMINPGCAGYETITRNHALSIDRDTHGIHPNCRPGVLAGNPIQEDILDSLQYIAADFLIETVLNVKGQIVGVFTGELLETHAQACALVDELFKVAIVEKADLAVVSCGGYPKDINFIQAHKSLNNAFYAVKEGGVILLMAECRDGIGSQTFLEWFEFTNEELFFETLSSKYTLNGTTALSLKMKTKKCRIIMVSNLPDAVVVKLGMIPAASLQEGMQKAAQMLPAGFTSYLIPNGSLTLPYLNAVAV